MANLYTTKTEISYEDYLKLEGLLVLAKETTRQQKQLIRSIADIIGEQGPDYGHAPDAVYGDYSAQQLLDVSEVKVLPPTELRD